MTGDHEGRPLQPRIRERLAEFLTAVTEPCDVGRVVVETGSQIDLGLLAAGSAISWRSPSDNDRVLRCAAC